jgi:hypothetical protein
MYILVIANKNTALYYAIPDVDKQKSKMNIYLGK